MKKIPYGISNYKELRDLNMYYVDKTKYIEVLEEKDRYQFFIRPRRFGKSLFLTMMECYYDINEKENFEKYFGELYIGKNKTAEANKYIVLKLNFSAVISDQGKEKLIESFDMTVVQEINTSIRKYKNILGKEGLPQDKNTATYALQYIADEARIKGYKMILLVDEYDNFANNMIKGQDIIYKELLHKDGYIRTFYKAIKMGTETAITKVFVTGVSPIMLDDVTSGANIFTYMSNDEDLNSILGFTQNEVEEMVDYYRLAELVNKEELMDTLKKYCNGYKFNENTKETVYNTDMVLYLIKNIIQTKRYPKNLIDENVKTDYTRLRNIAENFVGKEEMRQLIEGAEVGPVQIKERFNLESLYEEQKEEQSQYTNIRSLLYYLGLLTISKQDANAVMLKVPNYAISALYWEYMSKMYEIENSAQYDELKEAMKKMRLYADLEHIMEIYSRVINRMSNRDLLYYNEATSKGIFITLVYTDGLYLIESEKSADGGYTDLYIKENVLYKEHIKYRYMIEFKHIKEKELKGDTKTESKEAILEKNKDIIERNKDEAKQQIERYMEEYNIINDSEKELKKLVVITVGRKYAVWEIVE
ncbi:MAG: hypothetical protein A2Y24_01885 [Clostridiales bacterium GWE2_32_10]|nr:MAG: hypothetical protein A2Y24_01885 [Clostridiales bacterium GWE2_32_10]